MLITEYVGTRYCGFQWQLDQPTIQAELEKALHELTEERIRVVAASRTDTGVHAKGQVVSFRTKSTLPPERFVHGMNHFLPRDIAVKAAYRVADSFHVQKDAQSREYRYYILNRETRSPFLEGFSHLVTERLDSEIMDQASQALVGKQDFASFVTSTEGIRSTVRKVYRAGTRREGEMVLFDITGDSFMPHQLRNILGTLVRVGLGRMSLEEFRGIMEARKPGLAEPTAPAQGLFLLRVNYREPFEENM